MESLLSLPPPLRKANRRVRVSLRVEHWPAADQKGWRALFTTGDLFDERGSGSHLNSRSRTVLANAYGRWLGYLATTEPQALAQEPGERVTRDRAIAYARHLAETTIDRSVATRLRHLRGVLRFLAPGQDWAWLLTMAKRIEAISEPRSKRERLQTSDDLFALGLRLMQEAKAAVAEHKRLTKETALTYRDGLIIALLAVAPMRRRNLADLTLGQQVLQIGENWTIVLRAGETKNGRAIEYPLPAVLGRALEQYVEGFRPVLFGSSGHRGLWASAKGVPLGSGAIYDAVCRRTRAAFGQAVNLHLFRDGAATFWALKAPAQVRAARELLGHADGRTTDRYYNQANAILAGRRLADVLARWHRGDHARPVRGRER